MKKTLPWVIHAIGGNEPCEECGVVEQKAGYEQLVFHTHGIAPFNNGLELELKLHLHPQEGMNILNAIGIRLQDGELELQDGMIDDTTFTAPVLYKIVSPPVDGDVQPIMRVVLSDAQGKFPGDEGCAKGYNEQLDIVRRY